jgi:hypothetical protein
MLTGILNIKKSAVKIRVIERKRKLRTQRAMAGRMKSMRTGMNPTVIQNFVERLRKATLLKKEEKNKV